MNKLNADNDLLNLIQAGDIVALKSCGDNYIYTRSENKIILISDEEFMYLNQEHNSFISNKKWEDLIKHKLNLKKTNVNLPKNLHINISSTEKESLLIAIETILKDYNIYRSTYIIINIQETNLSFVNEIIKWFNGYERLIIICRVDSRKKGLIVKLKEKLSSVKKRTSIKIFIENYTQVFSDNNIFSNRNIKVNPTLLINTGNSDIENLSNKLNTTINFKQASKMIQSNLQLAGLSIKCITDNEILNTSENIHNKCNTCWAKNVCHQNGLYRIFSNHPYVCSINDINCSLIRNVLLSRLLTKI